MSPQQPPLVLSGQKLAGPAVSEFQVRRKPIVHGEVHARDELEAEHPVRQRIVRQRRQSGRMGIASEPPHLFPVVRPDRRRGIEHPLSRKSRSRTDVRRGVLRKPSLQVVVDVREQVVRPEIAHLLAALHELRLLRVARNVERQQHSALSPAEVLDLDAQRLQGIAGLDSRHDAVSEIECIGTRRQHAGRAFGQRQGYPGPVVQGLAGKPLVAVRGDAVVGPRGLVIPGKGYAGLQSEIESLAADFLTGLRGGIRREGKDGQHAQDRYRDG